MSVLATLLFMLGVGLVIWRNDESTLVSRPRVSLKKSVRRLNKSVNIPAHIWADAVEDVHSAIRAGLSLSQAVVLLATTGPLPIQGGFHEPVRAFYRSGDFAQLMVDIQSYFRSPLADRFVAALRIAHDTGGHDLGIVLVTLAQALRNDDRVRGELVARQSWTVNGARLAVAAPWVTVALLSFRSNASSVYISPGGLRMLAICAAVSLSAYGIMLRIAKLPTDVRIMT